MVCCHDTAANSLLLLYHVPYGNIRGVGWPPGSIFDNTLWCILNMPPTGVEDNDQNHVDIDAKLPYFLGLKDLKFLHSNN